MKKTIHLVSFDVPFPPNYGGIIDVYYKIIALRKQGISIILHTYIDKHAERQNELEKYCLRVFYYKRNNQFLSLFSKFPFRVASRNNSLLVENINKFQAPIIFEGLHTTFLLSKNILKNKAYVRTHNVEHNYFEGLAKSESNILKKVFYFIEARKLKSFEKYLHKADGIFTISPNDQHYFSAVYGKKATYIPVFHEAQPLKRTNPQGSFILYHGDLRISDNKKAVNFLIDVYKNSPYQFVIASKEINGSIRKKIDSYEHIRFEKITNQEKLKLLLENAHINTLISFQKTGIKLKLLNALHLGRHIIANSKMIEDTGLEVLCELADSKSEILNKTAYLFSKEYSEKEIENRTKILESFRPMESAKKMIEEIFKQ